MGSPQFLRAAYTAIGLHETLQPGGLTLGLSATGLPDDSTPRGRI